MPRVTPKEILEHYTPHRKLGSQIVLLGIGKTHQPFPPEPVNPRTGKKYTSNSKAGLRWRTDVRLLTDLGHNTEIHVMDLEGNEYKFTYQRDTLNSLARNVTRSGEELEVVLPMPNIADEEFSWNSIKSHIHREVAELLVAIPSEFELLELQEIRCMDKLRELRYLTVVPSQPLSLVYSHTPIPLQIRFKIKKVK